MRYRRPRCDRLNPEALAECGRGGGHLVRRSELAPQMQWAGDRLVPTGLLVCPRHMDVPNPQEQAKRLSADPVPVRDPRPPTPMVPLPGLLTDGTPAAGVTQSVLTDGRGVPLDDGTGEYQRSQHFRE